MTLKSRRPHRALTLAIGMIGALFITGAAAEDKYRDRSENDRRNYNGYENSSSDRYGYGNNYDPNEYIRCNSREFRRSTCRTRDRIRNVRLYDRRSDARCSRGTDWGFSDYSIWVSNGCRAIFKVEYANRRRGGNGYDNGYGYGNDHDGRRGGHQERAISRCIAKAERRLARDGFRRARFERTTNVRRGDRGWRVNLVFRVRHGNHFHYPEFSCRTNRNETRLTRYDFGDSGRRCGFNFRLDRY